MRYTKKPVTIEAIQLLNTPASIHEVTTFLDGKKPDTAGVVASERWDQYLDICSKQGGIKINTLESHGAPLLASFGDYVIKGLKGEFYPCREDIFLESYNHESVDVELFEATDEILSPLQEGISDLLSNINFPKKDDYRELRVAINNYFKTSDEVIEKLSDAYREENHYSSVDRLTSLQQELGYKKGDLSSVALLGLVGEAGEVLGETFISIFTGTAIISDIIRTCQDAESLKKKIRKGEHLMSFEVSDESGPRFDKELADLLGYINALCINRGLTLFDLCDMLHDKIKEKQLSGGSSEDYQKNEKSN